MEHSDLIGIPVLVFANKQDLPVSLVWIFEREKGGYQCHHVSQGAMSAEDVSSTLDLYGIKTHRLRVQPCSALTCDGIEHGVRWLVHEAKEIVSIYGGGGGSTSGSCGNSSSGSRSDVIGGVLAALMAEVIQCLLSMMVAVR